MEVEKLELARGGGNVFRDLGRKNADVEQLKALLAAEIVKTLDREELTAALDSRGGQPIATGDVDAPIEQDPELGWSTTDFVDMKAETGSVE
jgi:hypothetical protein